MALSSLQSMAPRPAREVMKEIRQLVTFRIGQEDFGVDILMVQEIIRLPKITPIPNAPEFILGVINLRGRIIPVIDLRQRLKIPGNRPSPDDKKTRILIVEMFAHVMGFIVDGVSEVTKVDVSAIEPTPNLVVSNIDAEYIKGMIKLSNRLIILLDFRKVLKPQENKELLDFEVDVMPGELQ
jgi:purine-binding chemotaxis protein CheW